MGRPKTCFQPTYEELKLVTRGYEKDSDWRFQPTYEELKLFGAWARCHRSVCFQPTYEELKLPYPANLTSSISGFPAYL